jgi:hypothetical protein
MAVMSSMLHKVEPGKPLEAGLLRKYLEISCDDTPIKVKIGDVLVDVREIRQMSTGPGEPMIKVLVSVDFPISTK